MVEQAHGLALDDETPALVLGVRSDLLVQHDPLLTRWAIERAQLALELLQLTEHLLQRLSHAAQRPDLFLPEGDLDGQRGID